MTFQLDLISCNVFLSEGLGEMFDLQEYVRDYELSHIPLLERRRLDMGGKGVFTLVQDYQNPIVFSSFNGEINRCLKMYESLKADCVVSPTSFSLSVLNAIPALSAILCKNSKEILAVSAEMSLEYGLLNASLLLDEVPECLVIAYREFEDFVLPNGVAIIAMRVKRGDSLKLTQCSNVEKSASIQECSEITFLKNYKNKTQWSSLGKNEQWEWNVLF